MSVLGMTVRISQTRPVLRAVLLDNDPATPNPVTYEHLASAGDIAEQMQMLQDALVSRLRGETIECAVLREADDGAQAGLTKDRRDRARGEGVALAVVRTVCPNVHLMAGPQVGRAFGSDLAAAETAAASLVAVKFKPAGAAALAARALL